MLYIVATPIGNLDDLTLRAAKTLMQSDVILAEDTRSWEIVKQAIVKRFNFKKNLNQKVVSYYQEKEFEKLPEVLALLEEGKIVSLISESGMPAISDPGTLLIKTVIKKSLPLQVLPGPTAYVTALAYAGFGFANSLLIGFLPKKASELRKTINKIKKLKELEPDMLFVFYESPNRINQTLTFINELIPDSDLVICRELTKKFEEITRGKAKELLKRTYRGEITVVLK